MSHLRPADTPSLLPFHRFYETRSVSISPLNCLFLLLWCCPGGFWLFCHNDLVVALLVFTYLTQSWEVLQTQMLIPSPRPAFIVFITSVVRPVVHLLFVLFLDVATVQIFFTVVCAKVLAHTLISDQFAITGYLHPFAIHISDCFLIL